MEPGAAYNLTPEKWRQIKGIFQDAVKVDPAEQDAFLEQACSGDEALRIRVKSMLSSDAQEWELLETPAFEAVVRLFAEDRPSLSVGQELGHYRVLGLIGAGGMGEVYLAEDQKLGRKIALKLLPADYTANRHRIHRFQHEARAASALNHPNIITIHEIGEFENRHFIITEFVEGETIRQILWRVHAFDLSEVLGVAIQVASALAAAHQAHIVHCDIKPENIMLRSDGLIKVLDFGLAKLSQPPTPTSDPTPTSNHRESLGGDSVPGILMGTVRYMSPEQTQGLRLDPRTDIFSLGVVIYEMVTGRWPFERGINTDLIVDILKTSPPPLNEFAPNAPTELQSIIDKALEKDRQRRYQSIDELLVDLRSLSHQIPTKMSALTESVSSDGLAMPERSRTVSGRTIASGSLLRRSIHYRIQLMVAFVLLLVIGAIAYTAFRPSAPSTRPLQSTSIRRFTSGGKARDAAISPDGNYVAYVVEGAGQQSLWVRRTDSNTASQVVPHTGVRYAALSFSPDSQFIYFVKYEKEPSENENENENENALCKVSVFGGGLEKIIRNVHSNISFSRDGKRLAFVRRYPRERANGLFIANADGTEEEKLAKRSVPELYADYPAGPVWSPDGQFVLCGINNENQNEASVTAIRIDDRSERLIISSLQSSIAGMAWSVHQNALILTALDFTSGFPGVSKTLSLPYPTGKLWSIRQDPGMHEGLSVTSDGNVLVTTESGLSTNVWVGSSEDMTQIKQITFSAGRHPGLSWTPDGRIVYAELSDGPGNLRIMEKDGTGGKQLSSSGVVPSVSADGKYVVFANQGQLSRIDLNGSNFLFLDKDGDGVPQCSPDSRWVIYQKGDSIYKISIDGGTPALLTDRVLDTEWAPAISPDGKLIAYYSNERHIEVIPFEGGLPSVIFPIGTADDVGGIQWAPDGRSILYVRHFGGASNIWRQPLVGGKPTQLTYFKSDKINRFALSQDGKQFAVTRGRWTYDVLMIETGK